MRITITAELTHRHGPVVPDGHALNWVVADGQFFAASENGVTYELCSKHPDPDGCDAHDDDGGCDGMDMSTYRLTFVSAGPE